MKKSLVKSTVVSLSLVSLLFLSGCGGAKPSEEDSAVAREVSTVSTTGSEELSLPISLNAIAEGGKRSVEEWQEICELAVGTPEEMITAGGRTYEEYRWTKFILAYAKPSRAELRCTAVGQTGSLKEAYRLDLRLESTEYEYTDPHGTHLMQEYTPEFRKEIYYVIDEDDQKVPLPEDYLESLFDRFEK